jgi:hypothetical protein
MNMKESDPEGWEARRTEAQGDIRAREGKAAADIRGRGHMPVLAVLCGLRLEQQRHKVSFIPAKNRDEENSGFRGYSVEKAPHELLILRRGTLSGLFPRIIVKPWKF